MIRMAAWRQFRIISVRRICRQYCTSEETTKKNEPYDIVVSGGGMVGYAMSCALASSKILTEKKVLMLEASPRRVLDQVPEKYSNRVSSLNPSTRRLFEKLDVWNDICAMRVQPVKKLQVWDECSESAITFAHDDITKDMAYIVENDVICSALIKRIERIKPSNLEIKYGTRVDSYSLPAPSTENELVKIKLNTGDEIECRLLIGADGVSSLVRDTMNIKTLQWSYNQKAVVGTLRLSEQAKNIVAWQRFLKTGPIALLPLTDDLSSLVWSTTPDEAKRLVSMTDEEFVDNLNRALWDDSSQNRLVNDVLEKWDKTLRTFLPQNNNKADLRQLPPNIVEVLPNSRASFPLGLGHASVYVGSRVALIGDAAHRVHPLAGQGVNLGFGDVNCLVENLEESVYSGYEIGSVFDLVRYEQLRQRQVVPVMGAIEILHRLYNTDVTPVVALRSVGLHFVNSVSPLKSAIMKLAS